MPTFLIRVILKAFEFERDIKKCKFQYFVRLDPDLTFTGSPSFETKYNNDFKRVLSKFEPAVLALPRQEQYEKYHSNRKKTRKNIRTPKHCIIDDAICGIIHMDFMSMTFHHELAENPDSHFITKFDDVSWFSNAFLQWNLYSRSFKSHITQAQIQQNVDTKKYTMRSTC